MFEVKNPGGVSPLSDEENSLSKCSEEFTQNDKIILKAIDTRGKDIASAGVNDDASTLC